MHCCLSLRMNMLQGGFLFRHERLNNLGHSQKNLFTILILHILSEAGAVISASFPIKWLKK